MIQDGLHEANASSKNDAMQNAKSEKQLRVKNGSTVKKNDVS